MPKVLNWIRGRKQPASRDDRRRRRIDLGDKPASFPIYAIGDVHGSLDLLLQAERKILADLGPDPSPALVVLLGDYVDRGRDSRGVLEHLLQPPPAPLRRIALCGNHEQLFHDFLENPQQNMHWLDFGGRQTLLSYGVDIDYFLQKGRHSSMHSFIHQLFITTLGALFSVRRQENLERRIGENHRAHVAAVGHQARRPAKSALAGEQGSPNPRKSGDSRSSRAYGLGPQEIGDITASQLDRFSLELCY